MCQFVSFSSLLTEKWSAFLQVTWKFDNGFLPLGSRHWCKAQCLVLCFPAAVHIILFEDSHSLQANEALGLSTAFNEKYLLLPLRVEGLTLEVHFLLLNNSSHFLPGYFLWCFYGKDLSCKFAPHYPPWSRSEALTYSFSWLSCFLWAGLLYKYQVGWRAMSSDSAGWMLPTPALQYEMDGWLTYSLIKL